MKYYIPTSSLNFNNILSTESISPKAMYEKRGFGYTRWFSVEENNCDRVTLLYDSMCFFQRPASDMEDHAMLIEITWDDEFPSLSDGVYYTDKTIYLNPWQTRFIFFSERVRNTVLSLSDSSLETKMVRLYQRKMVVLTNLNDINRNYPITPKEIFSQTFDIETNIEEDYIINKMKGLLYGYYIGANLSSSQEYIRTLDLLREVNNIFASVISSYDRIPSQTQKARLDEIFYLIEREQPIYKDLEKELGSIKLVDTVLSVFKKHGYMFQSIDRTQLIKALQSDAENNPAIKWINREIAKANDMVNSKKTLLSPEIAEIIVSSKEKLVSIKPTDSELMMALFKDWINKVLCSRSFNGKINSIKEALSDEITKTAKVVIGTEWDNSPIRTYLNQLRRHVRGEEFRQVWNNGVLSSMAAVLIKGDEWEALLHFMQNKGMFDYRLAFSIYGVLNGFANMTRDFTDLLLTNDSHYLSSVYREFYGQLHEKSIPEIGSTASLSESTPQERKSPAKDNQTIIYSESDSISAWRNDIKKYAESIIKRDKAKLLKSLDDALAQNADNQDYFIFITMLDSFEGWKPGKNGPSTAWKRMQMHYVPDYNQRIGKPAKKQNAEKGKKEPQKRLFDGVNDGFQHAAQTIMNALTSDDNDNKEVSKVQQGIVSQSTKDRRTSRLGKSILEDTTWINECAAFIADSRANRQFIEDMEWFVGNHNNTYNDKKKGIIQGYYAGYDRTNIRVQERLRAYMEKKARQKNEKMQWLAGIYANIPINKIMDYITKEYGC